MKGQSMMTALKLCLHSFSHFLQRSLYFIRLRWSRKKAHSNLYFLLNLGIVISCAFWINDYSRGVFLKNIWLRHGFLHMNNGYGHIYHLVGSKVVFWDLSGRQTAICLIGCCPPRRSYGAAPIAMSVAGRKYHCTLELSSHIAAATLPFGTSVLSLVRFCVVLAHRSSMLTVLPISQGKYLIGLLFSCDSDHSPVGHGRGI